MNPEQDWSVAVVGEAINIIYEDVIPFRGSEVFQTYVLLADGKTYRLVWSPASLETKTLKTGGENFLVYKDFTLYDPLSEVKAAVRSLWEAFYFGTEDKPAT